MIRKIYQLAMLYDMLGNNVMRRFDRNTSNNNSIVNKNTLYLVDSNNNLCI